MAEIADGAVIDGRYKVLGRIGGGGMADVYLAEDAHLQRRVALKVLHRRYSQDREFVERFRREAESAAGLQHPNIVAVYDRGEYEGTYFIAMQYVEGPTLKQMIESGLSPEQAVALIRQVLEGARFAHKHGIVHRDLKPQNVIVDGDGKAIVTDFGIARAGVSEITQTGSVMGTPHYLSPEQAQGYDVTSVSDLYSIGVMLYEALTGRVPFEGESAVAVAMKQVSQTPQRPSSLNPRVSPALDAVVMRALEKDPGQRFQSADAFIAALDAAMREPGSGAGTANFAALPPVIATPEEPVEEEDENRRWIWILAAVVAILVGVLIALALTRDNSTDVPDVTGNPLNVAIALLNQEGFQVGKITRVEREATPNTVLEQDPAASPPADQAEEDCSFLSFFCSKPKVALTVSAGPGSSKVPSLAGMTREEAEEELEAAGFETKVVNQNSSSVEAGLVTHTEPGGGSVATNGSEVTIFVSRGPKLTKVPVLVGSQRRLAVQEIRSRGLVPEVAEEESDSDPPGEVISQSPSAGEEVEPGSGVTIVVAKATKQVKVPGVVGEERREAVEALRAAGFGPFVEEEETSDEAKIGFVVAQSPKGGASAAPGSEVIITVGKRAGAATLEEEELEGE